MNDALRLQTGGRILVDALRLHGVDTVFCVPGESYLEVLDALYDQQAAIRLVSCRHESGAAFMAEAAGKLTGRPGICFVTRGPGATNASIAVHTAMQDATPMILFVGQVGRDMLERGAFQEVDYRQMFAPLAKWVAQIDDAARIPEFVARAFQTATSGRRGPVVLALPEDMLTDSACPPPAQRYQPLETAPSAGAMARLHELLAQARRPLMVLGGSGWTDEAWHDIARFAERNGLPVACSFRRQDLFDHRHAHYVGDAGLGLNPALAQRLRDADLLIAVGARLGEVPSASYTLLQVPRPQQRLVHVMAAADELGRVYQADLYVHATPPAFAAAARILPRVEAAAWAEWRTAAREDYLQWLRHPALDTPLDPGEVVACLRETLPRDAIVTNGAGNYSAWLHRHYQFSHPRCQLGPTSGAMGYGVPAAIAAKLLHPGRTVVCLAGDGCFLMTAQELATAVQQRAAVVFIVFNNGMYGTIRMHQESQYPARVIGTDIVNPDFVAFARSFGAEAERVERSADFPAALRRALAAPGPYCIELRLDPEHISPRAGIRALRAKALAERSDLQPEA
jgi:acetolactate synthase I/II/III large subunit